MAKPTRRKLTKKVVDGAKPDDRRFIIWDIPLIGFGLLVLPTGVKSYVYQYRDKHGRQRRATIGKATAWTCEQARRKAEDYRDSVKAGHDPLGEKKAAHEALTVAQALDLYRASDAFSAKSADRQKWDAGRIERHLKPLLGKIIADDLTDKAVKRAYADIVAGKTAAKVKTVARGLARVTGGEAAAKDTIGLLRTAIRWAADERIVSRQAAEEVGRIKIGGHRRRNIILEDAGAYRRLFRALDKLEARRLIRAPVADAIRVIALTGARKSEVAGLRWRNVDVKGGQIVLPPTEHKSGKATGEDRIIGLPAAAQAIIARQDAGGPDDFVFKAAKGDGVLNLSHPWRKVRKVALLPDGIGLHGLRHSLASHLAMAGAEAAEIMQAVGHRQMSTTARYIHWAQNQRARLAEKAAATALAGMSAAGDGKGEVVPLRGRK